MKKFLTTCLALSVFALTGMVSVGSVSASDLSASKINLSSELSGKTTFSGVTYHDLGDGYDYNEFTTTVTIDKDLIDTVLAQHPGNSNSEASLGVFYYKLSPTIDGASGKYKKYVDDLEIGQKVDKNLIDNLKTKVESEDESDYATFWDVNLKIQYKDASGNWVNVTDKSNGGITIQTNLGRLTGKTITSDNYGENYRFYINEKPSILMIENNGKYETIVMNHKSNFDVSSKVGDKSVYYPTLKEALESSDVSEVIINSEIEVNEEIVIPKNVTLNINSGAGIKLGSSANIKNYGTINNKGTIKNSDDKTLHVINVISENGTVELSKTTALADDEVTIKTIADNGYELKNVKVSSGNTEIEVKDGKFTMPDNDVYVTAIFEKIAAKGSEKNPKTGDNAMIFFMLAILGLGVTGLTAKKVFSK